jgi:hypothetical protein
MGGTKMKSLLGKNIILRAFVAASFVLIALAFFAVACGDSIDFHQKELSESQAKFTLRAYGETEMAYASHNYRGHFGTWDSLISNKFISEGLKPGNVIEDYKLWTEVNNQTYIYAYSIYGKNTFTAVAFPRITQPPGYLATFSIREDQILRIYMPATEEVNAWGENDDFGTRTWEPIR